MAAIALPQKHPLPLKINKSVISRAMWQRAKYNLLLDSGVLEASSLASSLTFFLGKSGDVVGCVEGPLVRDVGIASHSLPGGRSAGVNA